VVLMDAGSVLVTGATGGVGRALVEALAGDGVRVRAVIRPRSAAGRTAAELTHLPGVLPVVAALDETAALRRAARGVDVVVHLAALTRPGPRWVHHMVTVGGARSVLLAALQAGAQRAVVLSTTSVYGGPRSGTAAIREGAPLRGRGPYAEAKIAAELWAVRAAAAGLPVTVLRPTLIYGARSDTGLLDMADALSRTGNSSLVEAAPGERRMQPVHAQDVVSAVSAAIDAPDAVSGPFNVAGPDTVDATELGRLLAALADGRRGAALHPEPTLYSTARLERVLGVRPRVRLAHGLREQFAART
jgi:2-alkyl-3-oxoalkanoate reductase